ncbi:hypothetical protein ACFY9C_31285 [Streptomyces filamentosus]
MTPPMIGSSPTNPVDDDPIPDKQTSPPPRREPRRPLSTRAWTISA